MLILTADIDNLLPIIDTTPPTATIAATGHTYDVSTAVITLTGTNFDTMGIAAKDNSGNSGDASSVVDITKLSWDIDGAGDNTMTLTSDDVTSVILINDDNRVKLNSNSPRPLTWLQLLARPLL